MDMTKDLADQLRVLDASDNPQLTATTRAGLDVDREYTLEPLHPAHRGQRLVGVDGAVGSAQHDALAMLEVRRKHPVIAVPVLARRREDRRVRVEHSVRQVLRCPWSARDL